MEHETETVCNTYQQAAHLLSRRWTPLIVRILLEGPGHFNTIARRMPGINDRILSARLKELEAEGILQRRVYEEIPVRIEYILTEKGQALGTVVQAIEEWGRRWLAPEDSVAPTEEETQDTVACEEASQSRCNAS